MLELMKEYKHAPLTLKPNYIHIPVSYLGISEEGAQVFNQVYEYLMSLGADKIRRTPSGGISVKKHVFKLPCWDVREISNGIELTCLLVEGMWRFAFKTQPKTLDEDDSITVYPQQAFAKFKKTCAKYGIDLESYAIDNGIEVKKEIPSTIIKLERNSIAGKTFDNVHHIDFHSSFLGGLKRTHAEFAPVVDEIYEGRKTHPENKAVLNYTQGMMQSVRCTGAKWAHLVKDMISNNNARLMEVKNMLENNGNIVLSFNTDGIWYQGEIFHGDGEGVEAGTWGNDHTNCKWRAKSAGSYEYIEDGEYHVVQRGKCKLDRVKPRDKWEWGDIFKEEAKEIEAFIFVPGEGIVKTKESF